MMILTNISIFYLILFLALVIQIDQAKVLTGMSYGHRLSSRFVMKIDSIRENIYPDNMKQQTTKSVSNMARVALNTILLSTATMLQPKKSFGSTAPIVVLGSGGKTGKLVVEYLTAAGYSVRPTVREVTADAKKALFSSLPQSLIDGPISADVTSIASLTAALQGASAVVFAASASRKGGSAKQVDFVGLENVAKVCTDLKIPRLVAISSGAVTKPNSLGFKITNLFGGIMDYKLQGEQALRDIYNNLPAKEKAELSYAIIRPGGLLDGSAVGAGNVELNQGDTISGEVNRADVAQCAAAAAISKTLPADTTFEIYESGRSGPLEGRFPAKSGYERSGPALGGDYEILFKGLQTDSTLSAIQQ